MTTKTTAAKTVETGANEAAADTLAVMREASAKVGTLVADTQKSMTENFEKFSRGFEGLNSFNQDNIEALSKSSEIAAKAMEGIGSEVTAFSKKSFEDGVAAAQDFAAAKTMTELFEKQSAFAQHAFEGWLHQATKMNEIFVAAAKDITAPLGQRVNAAQDAMKGFAV